MLLTGVLCLASSACFPMQPRTSTQGGPTHRLLFLPPCQPHSSLIKKKLYRIAYKQSDGDILLTNISSSQMTLVCVKSTKTISTPSRCFLGPAFSFWDTATTNTVSSERHLMMAIKHILMPVALWFAVRAPPLQLPSR